VHGCATGLAPENVPVIPDKAKNSQVYESAGMKAKFTNFPSPYIYLYIEPFSKLAGGRGKIP
jgi:hypothetical protein